MSKVMFFCIPAHGHVNPTLGVVQELVKRGHEVRYYEAREFQEKIEKAGASFISCEEYFPPAPDDLDEKVGKDFASLIEMVVDTTLNMDEMIAKEMKDFVPDCIVADSVCFWGKLFAWKYHIPFICSTTTFAFNRYSARYMKQSIMELFRMFFGMPRINAKMKVLKEHGYEVKDFLSILQNDNETNTIVYTSPGFQPASETFSDQYAFVGPSIDARCGEERIKDASKGQNQVPLVYISLGTILNQNMKFYKACMEALKGETCHVLISVGRHTDIAALGEIPENFEIYPYVNQLEVLQKADVFLTHCGMNSVSESLYFGVPMILFPQHSEENAVSIRTEELGAGKRLKRPSVKEIRNCVCEVLEHPSYRTAAEKIGQEFRKCGGAVKAADFIEKVIGMGE